MFFIHYEECGELQVDWIKSVLKIADQAGPLNRLKFAWLSLTGALGLWLGLSLNNFCNDIIFIPLFHTVFSRYFQLTED